MNSLLQEIKTLPGVMGCFVYSGSQEIVGSQLPPIFKPTSMSIIGNLFARTLQMGAIIKLDPKSIEIHLNESMVMGKPLKNDAALIIICEPAANKSLIAMTTGMLIPDIEKAITAAPVKTQAKPQAAPKAKLEDAPPPPAPEASIDEALAPILENIKDALAHAIGPIASPVMRDTIDKWNTMGPTTKETLGDLVQLLCGEIDDPELEKEFMDRIKSDLP